MRALNAFVADVYGERRIVAEGVLPQRVLDSADNLEPAMAGVRPRDGVWIGIAGLDLVRDAERRVAGAGGQRAHAERHRLLGRRARRRLLRRLDVPDASRCRSTASRRALRRVLGDGRAVVLTDGPDNSAYWEHDWLARQLGIPLVVPRELELRGGRLLHDGAPVDAVYRRTNADEVDSRRSARCSHPVAARPAGSSWSTASAPGSATTSSRTPTSHDMIRFYLGEEPLLEQVETFDLGEPRTLERALDVFDELVDQGPRLLRRARRRHLPARRARPTSSGCASRCAPRRRTTSRSGWSGSRRTRPVVDGELAPRHVDLRPYVLMSAPDAVEVLPGGITRVALDEGALVVNSSQNGGAKDTWVLP